jgi:hypothetical protein
MITEEKIKQIRKQLRKGIPQGEIKNDLRSEGYTEEDIDKIFVPHKPDMRSWYLSFAVLFLLFGVYNLMVNSGYLFLFFAAAMFFVYVTEIKKQKKQEP